MEQNNQSNNNTNKKDFDIIAPDCSKNKPYNANKRNVPQAAQTRTDNDVVIKKPANNTLNKNSASTQALPKIDVKKIGNNPKNIKKTTIKSKATNNQDNKSGGNGMLSGIAKALIYIVFVISASGILSYFGIIFANDIFAFVKDEKTAQIEIEENTTVAELSELLYSNGMIKHPKVFEFYTWYRHRNNDSEITLKPGVYEVSSLLNYDMLLSTFKEKKAERKIVTITFKEGLTVDETIDLFIKSGVGTREGFIDAINNYDYDFEFSKQLDNWRSIPGRKYRLEGYLYPDTYDFYTDSDESFIISKLLSNFDQKFEDEYYHRCKELGYTVDEIINIASIIEKEGSLQEDLVNISSVFHNRLHSNQFPYLQSDATIQYHFENRKKEITPEDLQIDSLYNTYKYKGLPPSAIANPGLESILAAMYPADTNYYYFVTRSNGKALFASTKNEHDANVDRIKIESNN